MTSCFYIMSLRIIATRKWRVLKVTPTGGNTGGGVCGLWLPCCCDGSTDDFSLIIYVGVAVAAAFAVLLVIFCISGARRRQKKPDRPPLPHLSSCPAGQRRGTKAPLQRTCVPMVTVITVTVATSAAAHDVIRIRAVFMREATFILIMLRRSNHQF